MRLTPLLYLLGILAPLLSAPFVSANTDRNGGLLSTKENSDIRNGNFTLEDVPRIINNITEFLLAFAGTISVLVIIAGMLKMQLSSFDDGKSQGQKIVTAGIIGFIISASAWFIINVVVETLA